MAEFINEHELAIHIPRNTLITTKMVEHWSSQSYEWIHIGRVLFTFSADFPYFSAQEIRFQCKAKCPTKSSSDTITHKVLCF
jgi:hypothetical protein